MSDLPEVVWQPLPGSQQTFLSCPVYEALYHGTRGPGKTDCLLMDFAQHVGHGYGAAWRGVLFRVTHPQLADVIAKSKRWFNRIFPGCQFNTASSTWIFPEGEELLLRHMRVPDDYWNYHGHEYPWIGWEELTNWPDDICYKRMMSCSRSTVPGMPRKVRATTNPYGPGHNWVKARFRLPAGNGRVIRDAMDSDTGALEPPRVAIHGHVFENTKLLEADPTYVSKIVAAARNPQEREAWLTGSWDIVSGGMFDDVFSRETHVIPSEKLPLSRIPSSWRIHRCMDWGSSRPFSIGWFARSSGEVPVDEDGREIVLPGNAGTIPGDLILIREWYGCVENKPNEGLRLTASAVGEGVARREQLMGLKVLPGPADSSIFTNSDVSGGRSVATELASMGVRFMKSDKGPGSRVAGWEAMRDMFRAGNLENGVRERPGLFVMDRCVHWLRTVPTLPRSDDDPDDVDTDAEDHAGDMTRYRVRWKGSGVISRAMF